MNIHNNSSSSSSSSSSGNSNKMENTENEIKLIKQRVRSKEDLDQFNKLYAYCNNDQKQIDTLLVCYRHLLPEIYDPHLYGLQIHPIVKRPLCIGYLQNEDIVFYNDLDSIICNYLRNEGALVIPFKIEDFCFKASKNGIDIYIKDQLCKFDGMLSYGYRKKQSMETYLYISKIMQEKGIVCLHESDVDLILDSKLLQSIYFAKAKIPIPDTYQTFDIESTKALCERVDMVPCVAKPLSDYCGDNIVKLPHKWNIVNTVSKSIWKGENVLLQKFIPDSIGRAIRVLCFNNKAFTIIEFDSGSGDFRSNYFIGDEYARYTSLMDHEKFDEYKRVAEEACKSIGDLLIAGVDLIDSASQGVCVIEINSWPELFETWETTGINTVKKFAESFVQKVECNVLNQFKQQPTTEVNQNASSECYMHSLASFKQLVVANSA